MSLSNIFVRCFLITELSRKIFVSCIMHRHKMLLILSKVEVMSSHSCLSILLCLNLSISHSYLFTLVMNFMRRVIVLRMISKIKVVLSKIIFRLLIKGCVPKVVRRVLKVCVGSRDCRTVVISKSEFRSSHPVAIFQGLCTLSSLVNA